jgi:small subunit ribosomal protein S9
MARKAVKKNTPVYYATGRRKTAIAKVWITSGKGKITINRKAFEEYLPRKVWQLIVQKPLEVTKNAGKYDISVRTFGGGIAGQAGAIRHGISRALVKSDLELRPELKKAGLLTRDPRMKERKKYGRKRARKSFQWTKR